MAKAALDHEGVTGYNKEGKDFRGFTIPSVFARNWKMLAVDFSVHPFKKKQKKGAHQK